MGVAYGEFGARGKKSAVGVSSRRRWYNSLGRQELVSWSIYYTLQPWDCPTLSMHLPCTCHDVRCLYSVDCTVLFSSVLTPFNVRDIVEVTESGAKEQTIAPENHFYFNYSLTMKPVASSQFCGVQYMTLFHRGLVPRNIAFLFSHSRTAKDQRRPISVTDHQQDLMETNHTSVSLSSLTF